MHTHTLDDRSLSILFQLVTVFGFPYSQDISKTYRVVWSIFPPNLLAQGLNLLSEATATSLDPGVSWNGRSECAPNDTECVITMVSPNCIVLISYDMPNIV